MRRLVGPTQYTALWLGST